MGYYDKRPKGYVGFYSTSTVTGIRTLSTQRYIPVTDGVTSEVQLWVDAGKSTSYPGSGTTWSDISGNNRHLTLTGSPAYDGSIGGGSLAFNGSSTYARAATTAFNKSNGQAFSLSAWLRPGRTSGQYQTIIANRSAFTFNWILYQHATDGAISFHGSAQNKSTYVPTVDAWVNVTVTVTTGQVMTLYINGSSFQTVSGYTYATGAPSTITVGNYGNSEYWLGRISTIKLFNRTLSSSEASQEFNETRARYGV